MTNDSSYDDGGGGGGDDAGGGWTWPMTTTTTDVLVVEPTPMYAWLHNFSAGYAAVHGYLAAVVCVLGTLANTANILVLTRSNMVTCANRILTWLAVADLVTMTVYLPVTVHFYIRRDTRLAFPATASLGWIRFLLFHVHCTVVSHTAAIWLTISLAVFRCLCVCRPAAGARLCTVRSANLAVVVVFVAAAVVCVPNYLVTSIKMTPIEVVVSSPIASSSSSSLAPIRDRKSRLESTTANSEPEAELAAPAAAAAAAAAAVTYYEFEGRSPTLLNAINYWIQSLVVKLVPCLLLTIFTLVLVAAMRRARRRHAVLKQQGRRVESERAREHNRTTGMLLAVVLLFLVTELPQGVLTLCSIFSSSLFEQVYWPLGDLLDMTALINNSVNFVLYCSMSQQFRDTFVRLIGRRTSSTAAGTAAATGDGGHTIDGPPSRSTVKYRPAGPPSAAAHEDFVNRTTMPGRSSPSPIDQYQLRTRPTTTDVAEYQPKTCCSIISGDGRGGGHRCPL